MFICICNGITERQVREAIDQGASTLQDLTACLGVASGCGTCAHFTNQLLDQSRDNRTAALMCAA